MQKQSKEKSSTAIAIALIVILLGIGLSLYSLVHHYKVKDLGKTDAFCNISETLNCDAVASSAYSEFLTIPLGGYGIGFFTACAFLLLAGFTSYRPDFLSLGMAKKASKETLQNGFLLFTFVGMIVSVALGLLSHYKVGSLCPTCLGIYSLTFVLLLCALYLNLPLKLFRLSQAIRGCIYASIPVVVLLAATFVVGKTRTPNTSQEASNPNSDSNAQSQTVYDMQISTSPYHLLGEDYRKGSDDAKVTLVEFADFECPACGALASTLKSVHAQFGDAIRIVFKNFPINNACNPSVNLAGHRHACQVAGLARCAGQYGRFWQYHDLAFSQQSKLNSSLPEVWAKEVGLTDDQIQTCLNSKDILEKIKADGKLGEEVDVDGTPSLYINGRKFVGPRSEEAISAAITKLL